MNYEGFKCHYLNPTITVTFHLLRFLSQLENSDNEILPRLKITKVRKLLYLLYLTTLRVVQSMYDRSIG